MIKQKQKFFSKTFKKTIDKSDILLYNIER